MRSVPVLLAVSLWTLLGVSEGLGLRQKKASTHPILHTDLMSGGKAYLNPEINYKTTVETVAHHFTTSVIDVSSNYKEAPAVGKPGIYTITAPLYFKTGQFFFGFGKPNVFLAIVNPPEEGEDKPTVTEVAAKSLWREPMKTIKNKHGSVQSGYFLVPTNLPEEAVARIRGAALSHEGQKGITCLNQDLNVLADAGFETQDGKLRTYVWPTSFLEASLRREIYYYPASEWEKPVKLEFDVVRTTSQSLDEFYHSIMWAEMSTPLQHWNRASDTPEAREERKKAAIAITSMNADRQKELVELMEADSPEDDGERLPVSVAASSWIGKQLRRLWGDHILMRIDLTKYTDQINQALPEKLVAFAKKDKDFVTKLKENILFSQWTVGAMRSQMASEFIPLPPMTAKGIQRALQTRTTEDEKLKHKYNYVLTSENLTITRLAVAYKLVDWVAAKHLMISGYSDDVRCAGELWKDETGVVHVNADSGSYQPTDEILFAFVGTLSKLFPDVTFKAEPRDAGGESEEESAETAEPVESEAPLTEADMMKLD
uniref:Transmembrane protein n=1 Tax=Chromera velia CCMP2878 TaxID=1169474 RepID=A0A0G4G7I2_9ALVE|eukprot:Cvel_4298.t1-p1 / transcript=Cvel_4298.t1 / gene=Cvel_4298 / organism=Chromera_velia_CCMP2878 / gene_product=hypothetical protein / transcript_product=hypothetical protein / location=Cvel_scaffold186:90017-93305(-) / protein_length=542 / sequence_SO=supercontig / SO=protein_coding / is_pseudo=false